MSEQGPLENTGHHVVRAVDRALSVVEVLTDGKSRTLSELATELRVPKSTLHGILRTLESRSWIESDSRRATYRLGVRSLLTGTSYLENDYVVSICNATLDSLVHEFDETIHLGRIERNEVIYLAKRDSVQPLRLFSSVGRRLPAHATALGKVLLAQRPETEVDKVLSYPLPRLTPQTIVLREAFHRELQLTRQRSYGVDAGESTTGLTCIAVVIRVESPCMYAISCSTPDVRMTPHLRKAIIRGLFDARKQIEEKYAIGAATFAAWGHTELVGQPGV
jgi:DNA-binding IclR family transcriptional regulator